MKSIAVCGKFLIFAVSSCEFVVFTAFREYFVCFYSCKGKQNVEIYKMFIQKYLQIVVF